MHAASVPLALVDRATGPRGQRVEAFGGIFHCRVRAHLGQVYLPRPFFTPFIQSPS